MWLLFAFVAVPMIEIALFIQIGGFIGIWWTLLIVLATAMGGSYLVREQGLRELGKLQRSFSDMKDPSEPLANGAMILFAGALLLTPGFFTDAVGLALLVPRVRQAAFHWIKARVKVARFEARVDPSGPQRPTDTVIDGEYQEISPEKHATHTPSKWTRH